MLWHLIHKYVAWETVVLIYLCRWSLKKEAIDILVLVQNP